MTGSLMAVLLQLSQLEQERKQMSDMLQLHQQETDAALHDRDQAQKHLRELNEYIRQLLADSNKNLDSDVRSCLLNATRFER